MTVVVPFAHLGHVLIDLPVFLGPVAAVMLWVTIVSRRERAKSHDDAGPRPPVTSRGPEASR